VPDLLTLTDLQLPPCRLERELSEDRKAYEDSLAEFQRRETELTRRFRFCGEIVSFSIDLVYIEAVLMPSLYSSFLGSTRRYMMNSPPLPRIRRMQRHVFTASDSAVVN
jgi:hypothetical protein